MKTALFTFILLVMVLSITFVDGNKASAQVSFIISNQQSEGLGQVTVSTPSSANYVTVAGNSTDTISISDTAVSVTINGQTIPQGQQAFVTLPDQTIVGVIWETPCEIVVLDKDEIN